MSIRIDLDNQPAFYTNLDTIKGQVSLHLHRPEQIGSIVVKLEGEAISAPRVRDVWADGQHQDDQIAPNNIFTESHKILYKVQQVFPDDYHSSMNSPFGSFPLQPGQHTFAFSFKIPINNLCSDEGAMASLGIANINNTGLFGGRGARLMDGSKQLVLRHTTQTLPPSFRNVNDEAIVRYYLKVTVQRPGLLKENWRYLVGFKFLPIEPPRQIPGGQEAFARRPFTFKPRPETNNSQAKRPSAIQRKKTPKEDENNIDTNTLAPPQSIEISARLPHPPILTCNRPVPLRLIAKKLADNNEMVYLTSLQMALIGTTTVRAQGYNSERTNRWVVVSATDLEIPVLSSESNNNGVGSEFVLPDDFWKQKPLPNTIPPSFASCNINQTYALQLQVGLRIGKAARDNKSLPPETIMLPLNFTKVDVYSGIKPPQELLDAALNGPQRSHAPPPLPPRVSLSGPSNQGPASTRPTLPERPPTDPLYPPPLQPGETPESCMDAPPSYSEAMAAGAASPFDINDPRPPYSGFAETSVPQPPTSKH